MTVNAMRVAQYTIDKCTRERHAISNLQLQKILYFMQRDFLQSKGTGLFNDDFYAWQFGPVIPEVYYFYCGAGASKITMMYPQATLSEATTYWINPIIVENRDRPPWELVDETHKPEMAWSRIYKNGAGNHLIIPKELITEFG